MAEVARLMFQNDSIEKRITQRDVHVPVGVVRQARAKNRTEAFDIVGRQLSAIFLRRVQSDEGGQ